MKNEVYLIDNEKHLRSLSDFYYDLIIDDPPYGINWMEVIKKHNITEGQKRSQVKGGYKFHEYKEWDTKPPDKEYFDLMRSKSKYQIIWGGNYFADKLPPARCWIIWDKCEDNFTAISHEMAWTNFDRKIKMIRLPHWTEKGLGNKDGSIHPTQKPPKLYKLCLAEFALPGWKIGDMHLGSGSSRIACYDMGFHFEGCEIDEGYFNLQEKRFVKHSQAHNPNEEIWNYKEMQEMIYQGKLL